MIFGGGNEEKLRLKRRRNEHRITEGDSIGGVYPPPSKGRASADEAAVRTKCGIK